MLSQKFIYRSGLLLLGSAPLIFAAHVQAQIFLVGVGSGAMCSTGGKISVAPSNDCADPVTDVSALHIAVPTTFADNAVNFDNEIVQFSGSTVGFGGGTVSFNNTVTFTGPSVSFDTNVDFASAVNTNGIDNSGFISTDTLLATGVGTGNLLVGNAFTVSSGASIDMGDNVIQNVAAGVAATDAVNLAQLVAATSGITTDISALETTTATHTTQIAAVEAVNANQSNQISALQAAQDSVAGQIDSLFDLRRTDRRDLKQGVAAAMSMAQAPMPSGPGRISYALNGATFRGEYAVGVSLNYRLNTEAPMMFSVGASFAGNKNNGFRVGVAGEF